MTVDRILEELPDYSKLIKEPMDLSTILQRLRSGWYDNTTTTTTETIDGSRSSTRGKGHMGVLSDVQLVWANCERYHGQSNELTEQAKDLQVSSSCRCC